MNDIQKKTLRHHHPDILHDLDLTPELRSTLIQNGILNEDMVEEIMAERTRKDKVHKFLQILPRRGPRAFDKFLHSIHDHYSWISDKLRDTYHKLASKTDIVNGDPEAETVNLKKKVGIFVHEEFGNSKRFCEQDKKRIEKFLYSQLKTRPVTDIFGNEVEKTRRHSIDSTNSDQSENSDVQVADEKEIEIKILSRIYSVLDNSNERPPSTESYDDVDGKPALTIEMIENRVKDMSETCERLSNEMNNCFTALGIENGCDRPLHQIIERLVQVHENDVEKIEKLKETCTVLHEKTKDLNSMRENLERDLKTKENELRKLANELADSQEENEKFEAEYRNLKAKCNRLEKAQMKYDEKQKTLMTLKTLVKEMQSSSTQIQDAGDPEMAPKNEGIRLPKIHHGRHEPTGPPQKGHHRKGLLPRYSDNHEDPRLTNHPPFRHSTNTHSGVPWKF